MEGNRPMIVLHVLLAFSLAVIGTVAEMEYEVDEETALHQARTRDSRLVARFSLGEPQSVYRGECSAAHYKQWFFNKLTSDCRERFINASTMQELFEVYCDPYCADMYFDFIDNCGNTGLMISIFYRSLCSINEKGVSCFNFLTPEGHYNPKPLVDNNCKLENDTCDESCSYALEAFSMELGCCVNTLYNTTNENPAVRPWLWDTCQVAKPDFCEDDDFNYSAGARDLSSSLNVLSVAVLMLLMVAMK